MMTAFGSQEIAVEALRTGADDYLIKPFALQGIPLLVERTLHKLWLERRHAALSRQLESELAQAAEIQRALLPKDSPLLPGFELAARSVFAGEVGGDFYDWCFTLPNVFSLSLGDVMGKGMPAALLMATIRATLRSVASEYRPADAMGLAGRMLASDLKQSGMFITIFHAQLDTITRRLTFVDAGHGHTLVKRGDGSVERLKPRGLPLGIATEAVYREGTIDFSPGDVLIVYSDGLVGSDSDSSSICSWPPALLESNDGAENLASKLLEWATSEGTERDDSTIMILSCTG